MFTTSKTSPLICLFGPTAVGKTETLLDLLPGRAEVVTADSIQVYKGLDIGSAKPTPSELQALPHHLIDIITPDKSFSVGDFFREANQAISKIQSRKLIPVMAGGTAFYFKNFLLGMPAAPPSDPKIRESVEKLFLELGPDDFQVLLNTVDPETAQRLGSRDFYRQKRAYEVYLSSGKPLSFFKQDSQLRKDFNVLLIGLTRPRDELVKRIDMRVDQMMDRGLLNEVIGLVNQGYDENSPGMKGIGYAEFLPYILKNEGTIDQGINLVKLHSRQYAKRQMTFFRSLPGVVWIDMDSQGELKEVIRSFLDKNS